MPVITLVGHNEAVYDVCCNPVEPGILASCGRKGMVAIWDARQTGYLTFSFKEHPVVQWNLSLCQDNSELRTSL